MARLLFVLALVFLIGNSHAVSLQEDAKSCQKLDTYSGSDGAFYGAVDQAAKKAFPKGDFSSTCLNAQISPIDKTSAAVTVVFAAECTFQTSLKPSEYQCVNENNDRIGNRYYEVKGTAKCLGKPNNSDCLAIKSITDVTPAPSPPSPPPVGVWITTPELFISKDIQNAALAYMMKNAKITTVAPAQASDKAFYGPSAIYTISTFSRKIDANGGVTYKIPAIIMTQSAAKGCEFPILKSYTTVEVKKTAGKYTFSNLTEEDYAKALQQDSGMQPKCVGQASWKAGVAKINKFCKSVKGGCSSFDISD